MNILITTFGTRGDIQPFIALGLGLQAAGHSVGLCTSEGYRSFVESNGLPYLHMDNAMLELAQSAIGDVPNKREAMGMIQRMSRAMSGMMLDEWQAAQDIQPDVIIYHPKCIGSLHVAEKLGIPAVLSIPLPFYTPTRAFPVPFMANNPLGERFNRLTYVMHRFQSAMFSGIINTFRRQTLGLPAQGRFTNALVRASGEPVPVLYPFSPHVVPVPDDYPPHVHVTGYWFLDHDDGWQPDPALVRFLEAGAPPVYVGFGSMPFQKGAATRTQAVLDALDATQQRALLARGWGGLSASDLPANVMMLDTVPHDWLFPQVAAVVHHGGAGTTAAGLRAGKPTIVCPFLGDQPFWGKVVQGLGVGPAPIPIHKLTAATLTPALTATRSSAMQANAAALGEQIRAEDGIGRAVGLIETIAAQTPVRQPVLL
jgi:sterol 3beta-glucosyltransferase